MRSNSDKHYNKREVFSRRMVLGINTLYYISVVLLVVFSLYVLISNGIITAISAMFSIIALGIMVVLFIFIATIIAYIVGTTLDIAKNLYKWRNRN